MIRDVVANRRAKQLRLIEQRQDAYAHFSAVIMERRAAGREMIAWLNEWMGRVSDASLEGDPPQALYDEVDAQNEFDSKRMAEFATRIREQFAVLSLIAPQQVYDCALDLVLTPPSVSHGESDAKWSAWIAVCRRDLGLPVWTRPEGYDPRGEGDGAGTVDVDGV